MTMLYKNKLFKKNGKHHQSTKIQSCVNCVGKCIYVVVNKPAMYVLTYVCVRYVYLCMHMCIHIPYACITILIQ